MLWVRKGTHVLAHIEPNLPDDVKVTGELLRVLYKAQIREMRKDGTWPRAFDDSYDDDDAMDDDGWSGGGGTGWTSSGERWRGSPSGARGAAGMTTTTTTTVCPRSRRTGTGGRSEGEVESSSESEDGEEEEEDGDDSSDEE